MNESVVEVVEGPLTEDDALVETVEKALNGLPELADEESVARALREGLSGFIGAGVANKAHVVKVLGSVLSDLTAGTTTTISVSDVSVDPSDLSILQAQVEINTPMDHFYINLQGIDDEPEESGQRLLQDEGSGQGGEEEEGA